MAVDDPQLRRVPDVGEQQDRREDERPQHRAARARARPRASSAAAATARPPRPRPWAVGPTERRGSARGGEYGAAGPDGPARRRLSAAVPSAPMPARMLAVGLAPRACSDCRPAVPPAIRRPLRAAPRNSPARCPRAAVSSTTRAPSRVPACWRESRPGHRRTGRRVRRPGHRPGPDRLPAHARARPSTRRSRARRQGAEVIGSALLYPAGDEREPPKKVENCLAQGVTG